MMFIYLLTVLSLQIGCHLIPRIVGQQIDIYSNVNKAYQIDIPFKKCFQVETELSANTKYINFQPSSLKLTEIKNGMISQNQEISVLDNLRTPQSYSHQHLIVFENYALSFMSPYTFLVIKEINGKYRISHNVTVKEINKYTQFKIYKFNNTAMILLYNDGLGQNPSSQQNNIKVRAFIIDEDKYQQIKMPTNSMIAHLQSDGNEFFTAEYGDGVRCYYYQQSTKSALKVAQYSAKAFRNVTQNLYIVDININSLKSHNVIFALDEIKGVYRINLTESQIQPKIDLIIAQPNCNALDSKNFLQIVLVCQLGSSSYIVQSYAVLTQTNTYIYKKLQPEYHVNYFNDLQINRNYFLVFSHRTLNVYWSSKQNNIPETVSTRSQLDLPGLETFYFRMNTEREGRSFLYVIQSGVMREMEVSQSRARLMIRSLQPIEKKFRVSIFGNCQDLPRIQLQKISKQIPLTAFQISNNKPVTCQLQHLVNMQIVQQNLPRKQDFNVSASIIVILIVIFLLVIWICLKKYKGLERQARKVLDAYKRKRSRL